MSLIKSNNYYHPTHTQSQGCQNMGTFGETVFVKYVGWNGNYICVIPYYFQILLKIQIQIMSMTMQINAITKAWLFNVWNFLSNV